MYFRFWMLLFLISSYTILHAQDSSKKNLKLAGIPIINYNRTQGIAIGVMGSVYYKMNKEDTVSPSSNTGVIGMYTAQKSYAALAFQQFYLDQDKWRIRAAAGTLDINFQFYYDAPEVDVGNFVDYSTKANFAILQVQRLVFHRLYLGLSGQYATAKTIFSFPSTEGGDSTSESKQNYIGYLVSNDTRDDVNYPAHGMFLNFKNQFYRDWVGSDHKYTRYILNYNQFFDLAKNEKHILAVRANLDVATGDVPFEGQSVVGSDDIRGYSQGQYRGNQVYSVQSEYRWNFYKKWGMVGFFGLASAVENAGDLFHTPLLPGIGVGIRFRMIPSEKINIGIDGAVGKNDYSITFRIGEAFAR